MPRGLNRSTYSEECGMSLEEKQALPLETKLKMTQFRIREWHNYWNGNVFISNSGGRDSSVLAHIVMSMYPDVPNVFLNTGLEFPEIVRHVETFPNLIKLQPKMKFLKVIRTYGYPVISKETSQRISEAINTKSAKLRAIRLSGPHSVPKKWMYLLKAPFKISDRCCHIMKKRPSKKYEKETTSKSYIGTMAKESSLRKQQANIHGCNTFGNRPTSNPLLFWLKSDIKKYVSQNNVRISEIYDMGYERTGCVFCMFGVHLEKRANRFQLLKQTHPKLWKYCMNQLDIRTVLEHIKVPWE